MTLNASQKEKIEKAANEFADEWHKSNPDEYKNPDASPHADFKAGVCWAIKELVPEMMGKAMEWISLKGLYQEIDGKWYDKFGGSVRLVAEDTVGLMKVFEIYLSQLNKKDNENSSK